MKYGMIFKSLILTAGPWGYKSRHMFLHASTLLYALLVAIPVYFCNLVGRSGYSSLSNGARKYGPGRCWQLPGLFISKLNSHVDLLIKDLLSCLNVRLQSSCTNSYSQEPMSEKLLGRCTLFNVNFKTAI